MSDPAPPVLPADVAKRWTEASSTTETVMQVRSVEVSVATRVYDDARLRDAVRRDGGPDATLRFCFLSECSVPGTGHSAALSKLVTNRTKAGFADRLRDRGFESVRETGRRSIHVGDGDEEASAFGYEARCPLPGVTVGVEGWVAVLRGDAGTFYLAGGAYPTGVLSADDEATAAALRGHLDPTTFRADLFEVIRTMGSETA